MMKKKQIKRKKAQEEMVGFVLIIVLVAIIGLIFLVLSIRKSDVSSRVSVEVKNLLESLMLHTTNCSINFEADFSDINELTKNCYKSSQICINGESSCDVLKKELEYLLDNAVGPDEQAYIKAYKINIFFARNISGEEKIVEEFIKIKKGNCTGPSIGAEHRRYLYPGDIVTRLELYKSEI